MLTLVDCFFDERTNWQLVCTLNKRSLGSVEIRISATKQLGPGLSVFQAHINCFSALEVLYSAANRFVLTMDDFGVAEVQFTTNAALSVPSQNGLQW